MRSPSRRATTGYTSTAEKADDAKRLRESERENHRLKRVVADQALDIDTLEDVDRETSKPNSASDCGEPHGQHPFDFPASCRPTP